MIKNWFWFVAGVLCAITAVALGFQLWTMGGFFNWLWKLPCTIFAAMAAINWIDVGLNGDQPPR